MSNLDRFCRGFSGGPNRHGFPYVWRWLLYFAPWAAVLILSLGLYYRSHTLDHIESVESGSVVLVKNAEDIVSGIIQHQMSDTLLLAGDDALENFIESSSRSHESALVDGWIRTLLAKRVFDHIAYLDQSGQERVRVNFNGGQPRVTPPGQLENKAHQPHFAKTGILEKGGFYVSPLELNIEKAEIEKPFKPIMRFAVPVFDRHEKRRGALVVSYLADDLLWRLGALASATKSPLMLFNSQGYWLLGATAGDEWAFMFDRPVTIETRYPGSWANLLASDFGQMHDRHGLWTWSTFHLGIAGSDIGRPPSARSETPRPIRSHSNYFWKIVVRVPGEQLEGMQTKHRSEMFWIAGGGFLLLALVAWRLTEARRREESAEHDLRGLNQTLENQVAERTRRLQNEIFDRQMAERRYRESSEQYQHMVAATVDAYWLLDDHAGFLDVNAAACEMLGTSREALLGATMTDFVVSESAASLEKRMVELMQTGAERFELRLRRFDASLIDVEVSAAYLPDFLRFVAFVRDISERKRTEQERRLASMVMSNADEAIFVVSAAGQVISANPAMSKITGYSQASILGAEADRLGLSSADGRQSLSHMLAANASWRSEMRGRRKTGEVYPVWLSATAVRDDDGQLLNYVCVFSDITEIKESQVRLDFLAHHDALTSLPNRLLFRARLEHSLERASRAKSQVAVMFIDLDHFKEVNDTLGHAVGDQLLIDLAGAMTSCLRAEDTLARFGGDEFVVLLEQVTGRDSVDAVIEKLREVYPWIVAEGVHRIAVTASIGVAIYPENANGADDLVKQADAAMYRAKERGRDQAVFA